MLQGGLKLYGFQKRQGHSHCPIERLTSVKFVAGKLLNVENKGAVQGSRDSFKQNLRAFGGI